MLKIIGDYTNPSYIRVSNNARTGKSLKTNHDQVLAFRPGSTSAIEVLQCLDDFIPMALWLHGSSLYLSMDDSDQVDPPSRGGIYEYALPPELQLE